MNKTNLVFDFSNMAMRALFTCSYANAGAVTTFDTDEECGILIRKPKEHKDNQRIQRQNTESVIE